MDKLKTRDFSSQNSESFLRLCSIVDRLRDPDGGCPWDLKQTHESLMRYLLEESHEVIEAIEEGDDEGLCEELGDVLLQILLHARIAKEEDRFTIADVCQKIADKMVSRHPHVFGDKKDVLSYQEVEKQWELLKLKEKKEKRSSLLDGIPRSLSSLTRAERIVSRAAEVGFVFESEEQAWSKVCEEWGELERAEGSKEREEELGDLLFSLVAYSYQNGIDPDKALRATTKKFSRRFRTLEERSAPLDQCSLEEMIRCWNEECKE